MQTEHGIDNEEHKERESNVIKQNRKPIINRTENEEQNERENRNQKTEKQKLE